MILGTPMTWETTICCSPKMNPWINRLNNKSTAPAVFHSPSPAVATDIHHGVVGSWVAPAATNHVMVAPARTQNCPLFGTEPVFIINSWTCKYLEAISLNTYIHFLYWNTTSPNGLARIIHISYTDTFKYHSAFVTSESNPIYIQTWCNPSVKSLASSTLHSWPQDPQALAAVLAGSGGMVPWSRKAIGWHRWRGWRWLMGWVPFVFAVRIPLISSRGVSHVRFFQRRICLCSLYWSSGCALTLSHSQIWLRRMMWSCWVGMQHQGFQILNMKSIVN